MSPETPRTRTDSEIPEYELERIKYVIQQEERDRIRAAHHEFYASIAALLSPEEQDLYRQEGRAPIDLL